MMCDHRAPHSPSPRGPHPPATGTPAATSRALPPHVLWRRTHRGWDSAPQGWGGDRPSRGARLPCVRREESCRRTARLPREIRFRAHVRSSRYGCRAGALQLHEPHAAAVVTVFIGSGHARPVWRAVDRRNCVCNAGIRKSRPEIEARFVQILFGRRELCASRKHRRDRRPPSPARRLTHADRRWPVGLRHHSSNCRAPR